MESLAGREEASHTEAPIINKDPAMRVGETLSHKGGKEPTDSPNLINHRGGQPI